jgi:hypothetical protein
MLQRPGDRMQQGYETAKKPVLKSKRNEEEKREEFK